MLVISNQQGQKVEFEDNSIFNIKVEGIQSTFTTKFIKELLMEKSQSAFDRLTKSITTSLLSEDK